MQFKQVIGHQHIKQRLIHLVKSGTLGHALMFSGEEGFGPLPLAMALAQYVNCENQGTDDSCGTCPSCIKSQKLIHPDFHFVFPVVKLEPAREPVSDDFIKTWRERIFNDPYFTQNQWYEHIGVENKQGIIGKAESYAVLRKLNLKTFEAAWKIMLVWLPEKMNAAAANKLLKVLEEPAPNTLFLFVSAKTEDLLPTIVSRLQITKIPKIDVQELGRYLSMTHGPDAAEAEEIAVQSGGNYIRAMELISDENLITYNFDKFTSLMRISYKNNIGGALKWVDEMAGIGRERQKGFFEYSLKMLRESFVLNQRINQKSALGKKEQEFARNFSAFINRSSLHQLNEELNNAHTHIEMNGYNKLIFFDLSLRLMKLLNRRA